MRRILVSLAAMALLVGALAGPATASNGGAPRVTTMTGLENVPVTSTGASGFASITLNVGQQRVCWSISFEHLSSIATASHIHRAAPGSNGPIVVPLNPNQDGCTSADPALINEIITHPERFYVNVHSVDFPGGEIRGQLSNPGQSKLP